MPIADTVNVKQPVIILIQPLMHLETSYYSPAMLAGSSQRCAAALGLYRDAASLGAKTRAVSREQSRATEATDSRTADLRYANH
jgi:hypothetical protein